MKKFLLSILMMGVVFFEAPAMDYNHSQRIVEKLERKLEEIDRDKDDIRQWKKDPSKEPYQDVLEHEARFRLFKQHQRPKVRQKFDYKPLLKSRDGIAYITVHGTTFGTDSKMNRSFYQDLTIPTNEKEKQRKHREEQDGYFRNIQQHALNYANTQGKKIELLSFMWSGKNDDTDRKEAGKVLCKLITHLRENKYNANLDTIVIAHSHGCNVSNVMTNLVPQRFPIGLLIYLGVPVRPEDEYQPKNYKKIILFFTPADMVTQVGKTPNFIRRLSSVGSGAVIGGGVGMAAFALTATACTAPLSVPFLAALGGSALIGHVLSNKTSQLITDVTHRKDIYSKIPNAHAIELTLDGKVPGADEMFIARASHSELLKATQYLAQVDELTDNPLYKNRNNVFKLDVETARKRIANFQLIEQDGKKQNS